MPSREKKSCMAKATRKPIWHKTPLRKESRRWDLNPRPTHYECVALPLSYSGVTVSHLRDLQGGEITVPWYRCKRVYSAPSTFLSVVELTKTPVETTGGTAPWGT